MNQIEKLLAGKLEATPGDWSLRLELARSLFNRGEGDAAADVIGQAPDLPGDCVQLVEAARMMIACRPHSAEMMLQVLLESDPAHEEARQMLAGLGGDESAVTEPAPPATQAAADEGVPVVPADADIDEPATSPTPDTREVWHGSREAQVAHAASANTVSAVIALKPLPLQPPPTVTHRQSPLQVPVPTSPVIPEHAADLAPQPPPDEEAIRFQALQQTGLVTARPFPATQVKPAPPRKDVAKREKLSAAAVAVAVHVILILILGLVAISLPRPAPPQLVAHIASDSPDPVIDKKEVTTMARKSSSASASRMKVMAADVSSPVAVPTEDLVVETFQPLGMGEIGVGLGFGGGGFGAGQGRTGGSAFGFSSGKKGDLVGSFYDVKQDARGRPRENPNVVDEIRKVIDSKFSPEVMGDYFKASKKLYLTHLVVPVILAEEAPKLYGVENRVEPGQWFIHYTGQISPHRTGSYRLVGKGDDVLVVLVNGKVVLDGSIAGQNPTTWQTTEPEWHHRSPQYEGELAYGSWFPMTKGKNYDIDIIFGEAPGGHLSGFLLAERRGGQYETASDGRPVLPPFTVAPIADSEWKRFDEAKTGGADPQLAYSPFDFAREIELMKAATDMGRP